MSERKRNPHSHYERLGDQITGPALGGIVTHPRSHSRADGGTLPPGSPVSPAVAHGQDPPLPRRTAGNAPGGARISQNPPSADLRWKPPNPDLLRRLLAGLKRLG